MTNEGKAGGTENYWRNTRIMIMTPENSFRHRCADWCKPVPSAELLGVKTQLSKRYHCCQFLFGCIDARDLCKAV